MGDSEGFDQGLGDRVNEFCDEVLARVQAHSVAAHGGRTCESTLQQVVVLVMARLGVGPPEMRILVTEMPPQPEHTSN